MSDLRYRHKSAHTDGGRKHALVRLLAVVAAGCAMLWAAGPTNFLIRVSQHLFDLTHTIIKVLVHFINDIDRDEAVDATVSSYDHIHQTSIWAVQVTSTVLQIVAVPVAVGLFIIRLVQEVRRRRQEKSEFERTRYDILQQQYIDFLKLSLQYPELEFGPWPYSLEISLDAKDAYRRTQLGWILITIFEKAYLLKETMGQQHWAAWEQFMMDYASSEMFRHIWRWEDPYSVSKDNQMDSEFEAFMEGILAATKPRQFTPFNYQLPREKA